MDKESYETQLQPAWPSETVQPGVADAADQQGTCIRLERCIALDWGKPKCVYLVGATQPGSGSTVPIQVLPAHQPSFKEKVVGKYASLSQRENVF